MHPPPPCQKTKNLTEDLKDLQGKNYKTIIKETEWTQVKNISCLWVKIPFKYSLQLKQRTHSCNHCQHFNDIFHRNKCNLHISVEPQRNQKSQRDPEKAEQAGGMSIPEFNLEYAPIVITRHVELAQK